MYKWSRTRLLASVAALALIGAARSAVASPAVYAVGASNEFGTIDLTTGTFNEIGTAPLALPNGDFIYGLGFGANGLLYGVDSANNASLYQINTSTAAVTDLGHVRKSAIGSASDASGVLFVLSQATSTLYTLKPPSTTATSIGSTGITSEGLAAVTPDGSHLYTSVGNQLTDEFDLDSVSLTNGHVTDIGDTGFQPTTGFFLNGTLYGFDDVSDAIITLNTTTGAGTQVATYSLPGGDPIYAVAVAPVPEPASFALVAVACAGLLGRRHRRPAN